MKKETLLWITLGLGVGLLVASAFTYTSIMDDRKKRFDPRKKRVEDLLDEAEQLLDAGRRGKAFEKK